MEQCWFLSPCTSLNIHWVCYFEIDDGADRIGIERFEIWEWEWKNFAQDNKERVCSRSLTRYQIFCKWTCYWQNIHHVEANTLRCYYSPKEVIKYCLNSYYLLTIARALNSLLNDERYAQWMLSGSDIVSHDPTFITPMAVMLINYILLHKSTHPFLIHLRGRKMVCANLAFMSGLLFVPLPLVLLNIT